MHVSGRISTSTRRSLHQLVLQQRKPANTGESGARYRKEKGVTSPDAGTHATCDSPAEHQGGEADPPGRLLYENGGSPEHEVQR